jgi:hypothetical protein
MTETEAFIAGWAARGRRDQSEIEHAAEKWAENGPSKATSRFIIKLLGRISDPKPEEIK